MSGGLPQVKNVLRPWWVCKRPTKDKNGGISNNSIYLEKKKKMCRRLVEQQNFIRAEAEALNVNLNVICLNPAMT